MGRGNVSLGTSLETIGSYAFYNSPDLGNPSYGSLTLPDTVTSIGTYAFNGTYAWRNASGVIYIGDWVVGYVEGDSPLPSITIRDGTIGIANYAFYNAASLTMVTIPYSVQSIGMAAFYGCSSLVQVTVNDLLHESQLREIGEYAFYKCSSLSGVYLPEGLETIGRSAFYRSGLTSVEIPSTVTEIGPYAFYRCEALTEVTFAGGAAAQLRTVGTYAFAYCQVLEKIELPDAVTTIETRAFSQCRALTTLSLGQNLTFLGDYAFYYCMSLTEVTLPDSLTAVGGRVFYRCSALASVTFGSGVTCIGDYAFYGCSALTELDLPLSLREIGDYAFRSCTGLTSVILGDHVEAVGIHAFNGARGLTVYCEAESAGERWHARWNSGYRPVVWGCTLSDDESYVVSFVKTENSLLNPEATNGISDPLRDGYTFAGWRTQTEAGETVYSSDQLKDVPDGTALTAVWTEGEPEPEPPVEEEQA